MAEAPGYTSENKEINVIGGERQELTFQLRGAASSGSVVKPGGTGDTDSGLAGGARGGAETAPSSGAMWWYASAGVAAAGAVGALFWWRSAVKKVDRCDAAPSGLECYNRSDLAARQRLSLGTTIGAASAALVLGIIGTVVWATNSRPESGTAIACGLGPGAVNCDLKVSF
jgi:hypothetical protein